MSDFSHIANESASVEKIIFVCKISKILKRRISFKQEFVVDNLNYNWDTSVTLF